MVDGRDASERIMDFHPFLFTFPSRSAMVSAVIFMSVGAGITSFVVGWGAKGNMGVLMYSLFGLAVPLLLSDAVVIPLFRGDSFLNPRRFTIVTFASTIVYAVILVVSSIFCALTNRYDVIVKGVFMAVAINASLRYLTIRVFTANNPQRNVVACFTQPALCFVSASTLLPLTGAVILGLGVLAILFMVGGIHLLLSVLANWRGGDPGLKLIPLFRSFILAWAEDINGPLEDQLTGMGEVMDLAVDSIAFDDEVGSINSALLVPYIHPGPFRNVGSSGLPQALVERVRERHGSEALVAHGVSDHTKDLTRNDDCFRVAEAVALNLFTAEGSDSATPLVWAEREGAHASCQLFGNVALVTLSLSPKSYDDLPEWLYERIAKVADGMGLKAVVVDSHNSIKLDAGLEEYDPNSLYEAAKAALQSAEGLPKCSFAAGSHRVVPEGWGIPQGMGPAGIAALAIRLEKGQTSVYVVVDGNNMVSGLREKVVGAVKAIGVDEVEIMTSDTHVVNGIGAITGGYSPIGERTGKERVIKYALEAVENSISMLRISHVHHARTVIPHLTVLGSKGLDNLSDILESGFSLFKKAGLIIMPIAFLLTFSVLYIS